MSDDGQGNEAKDGEEKPIEDVAFTNKTFSSSSEEGGDRKEIFRGREKRRLPPSLAPQLNKFP